MSARGRKYKNAFEPSDRHARSIRLSPRLISSFIFATMLSKIALASSIIPVALACLGYEGGLPQHTAHYSNSSPIEIAAGETFDAGWAKYDRGSGACSSGEGGNDDAVFILRSGATLRNVIIGKDQKEGVHCEGPCTLEFVWFEDVCEDAITVVRLLPHPATRYFSDPFFAAR